MVENAEVVDVRTNTVGYGWKR